MSERNEGGRRGVDAFVDSVPPAKVRGTDEIDRSTGRLRTNHIPGACVLPLTCTAEDPEMPLWMLLLSALVPLSLLLFDASV